MSAQKLPLHLRFYGISPWELEVLFSLFHSIFDVKEEPDVDQEEDFTTLMNITIPYQFNEVFFKWFGTARWDKIKGILKEMKRRRGGGKSLRIYIKFLGNPSIKFIVDLENKQSFDTAVDKIDFVLELLPYHLDMKRLPNGITEILYQFNELTGKWDVTSGTEFEKTYRFSENDWKII